MKCRLMFVRMSTHWSTRHGHRTAVSWHVHAGIHGTCAGLDRKHATPARFGRNKNSNSMSCPGRIAPCCRHIRNGDPRTPPPSLAGPAALLPASPASGSGVSAARSRSGGQVLDVQWKRTAAEPLLRTRSVAWADLPTSHHTTSRSAERRSTTPAGHAAARRARMASSASYTADMYPSYAE